MVTKTTMQKAVAEQLRAETEKEIRVSMDGKSNDGEAKRQGSASFVLVPRGWNRIIEKGCITYISPNKSRLGSMEDLKEYLLLDGTCKCGLICPLTLSDSFNFEVSMPSRFNGSGMRSDSLPQQQGCCVGKVFDKAFPPINQDDIPSIARAKQRKRPAKDPSEAKQKKGSVGVKSTVRMPVRGPNADVQPVIPKGGNATIRYQDMTRQNAAELSESTSQHVSREQAQQASSQVAAEACGNRPNSRKSVSGGKGASPGTKLSINLPKSSQTECLESSNALTLSSPENGASVGAGESGAAFHVPAGEPPPNVTVKPSLSHNLREVMQAQRKRKLHEDEAESKKKPSLSPNGSDSTSSQPPTTKLTSTKGAQWTPTSTVTANQKVSLGRGTSQAGSKLNGSTTGRNYAAGNASGDDNKKPIAPATKVSTQKSVASVCSSSQPGAKQQLTIQPKMSPDGFSPQLAIASKNAFYTAPVNNNVTQYLIFGGSGASQALQNLALQSTPQVTAASMTDPPGFNSNRFIQPFAAHVNYVASVPINVNASSMLKPAFQVPTAPAVVHYLPRGRGSESSSGSVAMQSSQGTHNVNQSATITSTSSRSYVRIAPAAQEEKALFSVSTYSVPSLVKQDTVAMDNQVVTTHQKANTRVTSTGAATNATEIPAAELNSTAVVSSCATSIGEQQPSPGLKQQEGPSSKDPKSDMKREAIGDRHFVDGQLILAPLNGIKSWPGRVCTSSAGDLVTSVDDMVTVTWLNSNRTASVNARDVRDLEDDKRTLEDGVNSDNPDYAMACKEGIKLLASSMEVVSSTSEQSTANSSPSNAASSS